MSTPAPIVRVNVPDSVTGGPNSDGWSTPVEVGVGKTGQFTKLEVHALATGADEATNILTMDVMMFYGEALPDSSGVVTAYSTSTDPTTVVQARRPVYETSIALTHSDTETVYEVSFHADGTGLGPEEYNVGLGGVFVAIRAASVSAGAGTTSPMFVKVLSQRARG